MSGQKLARQAIRQASWAIRLNSAESMTFDDCTCGIFTQGAGDIVVRLSGKPNENVTIAVVAAQWLPLEVKEVVGSSGSPALVAFFNTPVN